MAKIGRVSRRMLAPLLFGALNLLFQSSVYAQPRSSSKPEIVEIMVDLGPWDAPETRKALELRRDRLFFESPEGATGWRLRLRAIDDMQRTVSAVFSSPSGQSYIQEFDLDPQREDAQRQVATSLANWLDAVFANEHRPATDKELKEQRRKEESLSKKKDSAAGPDPEKQKADPASEIVEEQPEKTRAEPASKPALRNKQRPANTWSWTSPTRWELGLGLGLGHSLQGGAWLPGLSWLQLEGIWTPKRSMRLGGTARLQSHALENAYVHRARLELGPEWMASSRRIGVFLGCSGSLERWWTDKELRAPGNLTPLVSLGAQVHAGMMWRLFETESGVLLTGFQAQLRFASELPGWVIPTVSLQREGTRLFLGGFEGGVSWTLRWGRLSSD